ncbi:hypothetical protein D6777_00580, partial [Candidatus Woesearchaeota archaeon]
SDNDAFSLNLSINTTDIDGDSFNFSDNTSMFNIDSKGIISFTATDFYVGTNWVRINITDEKNAINQYDLNFTIYNVEEAPVLDPISNITNATEGQLIQFDVTANDEDRNIPGSTETLTFSHNSTLSGITFQKLLPTLARFSFTPGAADNGTYFINITVNDTTGLMDSQVFMLNISDAAAPPRLQYVCDNERVAYEDQPFSCIINASDNDTYAELRFRANYSFFKLNESNITTVNHYATTVVNFTPTQSEVGNYTINITVYDNMDASDTRLISFNVTPVNDAPILNMSDSYSLVYNTPYTLDVSDLVTDEENDAIYYYDNTTLFDINLTTGIISFTPNASHSPTNWVNISINDSYGNTDSQVVNFSIYNNSNPTCTTFRHNIVTDIPPPGRLNATENTSLGQINLLGCSDPEGEYFTISWYWNASLKKTGSYASTTTWDYNLTFAEEDEVNITVILNDTSGGVTKYYWNVTVFQLDAPPILVQQIPNLSAGWDENEPRSMNLSKYFRDYDKTNLTFSWYYISINETFSTNYSNVTITNLLDNKSGDWGIVNESNNTKYAQLNNSVFAQSIYKLKNDYSNITEFRTKIKFLSNGIAGLCIEANDDCNTAQQVYLDNTNNLVVWKNVNNGVTTQINDTFSYTINTGDEYWLKVKHVPNRTIVYVANNSGYVKAYNITYPSPVNSGGVGLFTNNAQALFDDVLLKDPIVPNITVTINETTDNITFMPATDFYGEVPITIVAFDGNHSVESNTFYLIIDQIAKPAPITNTVNLHSSSTSVQTQIASLDIIVPSLVSLTPLAKTIVPIVLNNSGQLDLNFIDLLASTNQSELKLLLNNSNFTIIPVGESRIVELEITAGLLTPDRYTIDINAFVDNPDLEENAQIVVDVRERNAALKTQLKEQIRFTRDLFLQNPECLELNELLEQAQKLYELQQYEQGLDLVHKANEGCKDFIAQEKKERGKEKDGKIKAQNFFLENWKTIVAEVVALILAILLLMYYFKRRTYSKPI